MVFMILTLYVGNAQIDKTFKSQDLSWCESNKSYVAETIKREAKIERVDIVCRKVSNK